MSPTLPPTDSPPHLRRPLAGNKGAGGDMTMMFFAQPDCPVRFAHQDEHRVKGLNAEAIARVLLPIPSWLRALEYDPLRARGDDAEVSSLFFSLNLSIYGVPVVDSDWTEQWFFMSGRVHPYALAWEIERRDGLEAAPGDTLLYTMPALVVRDQGYQPVLPRSLASDHQFPSTPPVVSFYGVVAGSGLDLLHADLLPGLGSDQLRCCGLIQLSTYIAPGVPDKVPFKGYHPFQAFVIFPIYANPWLILCKKLAERSTSPFLPGTPFTCTGKVAGLLDHGIMCSPPGSDRDYVFIVVPDSWSFHDRSSSAATASASPQAATLRRQPASASSAFELVRAASFSLATPPSTAPPTPSKVPGLPAVTPVTPPPKRACAPVADSPLKRTRPQYSFPSSSSSTVSSATTSSSPPLSASSSRLPGEAPATALSAAPTSLDSIVASTSDPPARPLRQRMQK
ncbi:hypothetical protein HRG_015083 [Hirsutella rhossiliensis]